MHPDSRHLYGGRKRKTHCKQCGQCCRNHWLTPPIDTDSPPWIRAVGENILRPVPDPIRDLGPCVFLDGKTNRCTVYEHRPKVCREFREVDADGNCQIQADKTEGTP